MTLTVDQFGKALVSAGLFTADELKALWNAIPADARPKQGEGFARLLVQQGKLNQFQADELLSGRNTPLVMGDYLLVAELGAGGMGKVYKARHRRMERIVALKVMSTAAMQDEAAVKRFQREVKAAARLEHPNIVTAYDSGEAGSVKYLVMQFVDGGDLSDLVKKNGPLPIERAVDYVLQAARGLAFAHEAGVVHRDIKPANLLCDKKGVVKILDMGLARIENGDDGLTATEQVMGTVDYMSPEQASNTKAADARSDIYSLGCTLWFLLTGKKAYDGDSMIMRLMAHRDAPLPSLVKTREDVPWTLEQAFHKMIAKRADDRFQTMEEVVAALDPFAGGNSQTSGMGSSIGHGGAPNAELSAFLKTVGPGPKTQAKPATAVTNVAADATAQFVKEAETDPKSEIVSPGKLAAGLVPRAAAKPQAKGSGGKSPPNKNRILAGAGGAALLVMFGVWFIFRDKDGNEVARVQMPEGGSVTVQQTGPAGTKPAATPSGTISFLLPGMTATGVPSFTSSTAPSALQVRWPLVPSRAVDIQWLVGLGAEVTLRTALPSVNSSIDQTIKSATEIPAGAATIVGIQFRGSSTRLTDADFVRLCSFMNLESLSFEDRGNKSGPEHEITGQGWGNLAALKHLRTLRLEGCRPVTVLPDFMSSLTSLELLNLQYPDAAEWARAAAAAPALKNVVARRTQLGDAGLAHLEKRTSLLEIDLRGARVTQPAIDHFAAALPQCRITYGDDDKNPTVIEPRVPPPAVPSANGVVYLDDLQEKSYFGLRAREKPGRNPTDVATLSKYFSEASPVHALLMHPEEPKFDKQKYPGSSIPLRNHMARLVYDLDGKYAAFRSGFRVRAGNDSPFVAEVWGDGKRLWESGDLVPLGVAGATADVDVRGVRELTLIVAGDDGKRHALLIEPRLTLVSIAAPPAGATVGNAPPPAVAPFDAAQARAHQEAWAKHLGTTVETVNSVGQKMILIPPGEFLMGSTDEQLEALRKITEELKIDAAEMTRVQQRERPQHRVVITKPFRLSATEVTVGQFKKFVAATGYRTEAETIAPKQVNLNTATDDLPTAGITWSDAEAYCKWLSEQEKATYRLPTEAEWEFACRAGTATQYSFGDDAALLDQYEWNYKNSRSQLQSAGTKLPNGFGLYDMHGSLHEWCRDYFAANWYGASPPNDPIAPQTGSEHVTRGGNYWAYSNALQCRSAYRGSMPAANKYSFLIGFRCARELDVPAVAASTTSPKPPSPGVVSPVPKPTPTGTQPPPEATGVSPAAPRWPLAPSKPEDIVWLQGLKATLTLRAPSAFGGGPTDVQVKPGEPLPGGAATIVGINFGRDNAALMTDDVLKRTATLVDLEDLNLSYAKSAEQVTKDGLPQLAALVNLRRLNLERIGAKETDPAFLERFVKLESLRLGSQPFLNLEQHIARLPALAELHLNKMDLTNLRRLGPLPRLTELGLGDYGAAEGSKRHEAAKQYAPLVPWCRITVFGPNTPDPRVVIEPTASPPGN